MSETLTSPPPVVKPPSIYVTQHCANGNCEGTKNKSDLGALFPTCRGVYQYRSGKLEFRCTCKCHSDARRLREMLGLPEPDYAQSFAVPSSSLAGLAHSPHNIPDGSDDPTDDDGERPAAIVRDVKPTFEPTESGRLQRGQLEDRVYTICKVPSMANADVKTICTFIGMKDGSTPSAGAVSAVLDRWQKAGIAEISDRPTRFVKFSERVLAIGLWEAKDEIVRAGKRAGRGFF